jgi:hypothetical protein
MFETRAHYYSTLVAPRVGVVPAALIVIMLIVLLYGICVMTTNVLAHSLSTTQHGHTVVADGHTYELMRADDTVALARLKSLRLSGMYVAKHMHTHDDPSTSDALMRTLHTSVIGERGPPLTRKLGSTIDKGRTIYLCLRTATGELQDEHSTLFVFLHELAHTVTASYNHTEEFQRNFERILSSASALGLYDSSRLPTRHCGMLILQPRRPRFLFGL